MSERTRSAVEETYSTEHLEGEVLPTGQTGARLRRVDDSGLTQRTCDK